MFSIVARYSVTTCQRAVKQQNLITRRISFLEKFRRTNPPPPLIDKSPYKLIYEFKYIVVQAGFLRLKYSLPLVTLFLVPVSWLITRSAPHTVTIISACCIQLLIVQLVSKNIEHTVGKLYINRENENEVLISSLDILGRRIDRTHKMTDLECLGFKSRFHQIFGFQIIRALEPDILYKLNVKSVIVHDSQTFTKRFGLCLENKFSKDKK